ncbi:cache domain-containing protein, partial [Bacillus sonorensis]
MGKLWDWIKRPSISKRLIFSFLFILTIPVAVLACSSYYTAGSSLESEMMISARNSVDQLNKMIDQNVEKKADAIAYFSETIQDKTYKEKDQASVREKFAQYAKQNKDVEAVFTGSKDSIYVQYPRTKMPENYDPVERGWYQEAVAKKGEIIVTEPYKSAATGNTVITIAKQNQDGSGVAALSLNIDELIKATNDVKIGTSGFAFISSADQKYVAHPKAKAGTAGEGDWMKQMYSKDKGLFSYTFEGKEKQMVFVTNKLTGWKIGGTMVTDEITAAAQPVFNMAVIILAAAIVLGGILV